MNSKDDDNDDNNCNDDRSNTFSTIIDINIMTISDEKNFILVSVLINWTLLCVEDIHRAFPYRWMMVMMRVEWMMTIRMINGEYNNDNDTLNRKS